MKNRKISKYLTPFFETKDNCAEWFGYYNYDPLNHNRTRMLCNRSQSESHKIAPTDRIELGYYEITKGEWHHIDYSDAWNWQQGAMMQWLPGKGNQNKVIYNCSKDNHLISRIKDVETGETKDINWSIYGITPDGKKSISLDFERSYWCRAYHYQSVAKPEKEGRIVEGDGIFEIDLEKNERRLLIDIHDIVNCQPDKDFDKKKHWVEHIMINPDGTRFCFLHRYSSMENVLSYQTRVFIANIDGSELTVIPGWNKYMWSHFGWQNNTDFSIYTYMRPALYKKLDAVASNKVDKARVTTKQRVLKLLVFVKQILPKRLKKMVQPRINYYQHYKLVNGAYSLDENWNESFFDIDGHPSFTSDGRYMLTDSYPDLNKYRRYIVYDTVTHKGVIVAKMPENRIGHNVSCDLHPKLSTDNNYVIFDNTSLGKHSMVMFKINWAIIKKKISNL